MFSIIFVGYLLCAFFFWFFYSLSEGVREKELKAQWIYKTLRVIAICFASAIGIGVVIGILWVLGWIWYYFCGGFLVIDDFGPFAGEATFWERVVYGLLSLLPLGFIIGFIAVLGGWNPD